MVVTTDGSLPLAGKTILVTRAAGQAGEFSDRLQSRGATVIEMPTLEITPPSSWDALDGAIAQLHTFDWLILTSANGVQAFFERLARFPHSQAHLQTVKIAVVGKKTSQSLQKQGYRADFIPPNFVADALISHFPDPDTLPQAKLLFPRVESGGRKVLVQELTAKGATVCEVPAYQSQCPAAIDPHALAALDSKTVDIITFASSKTVRYFVQLLAQALFLDTLSNQPLANQENDAIREAVSPSKLNAYLQQVCIASIGPQTSQTCQEILGRVDIEAQEYTLDGLLTALQAWCQTLEQATKVGRTSAVHD